MYTMIPFRSHHTMPRTRDMMPSLFDDRFFRSAAEKRNGGKPAEKAGAVGLSP